METDWRQYCRSAGITPMDGGVEIHFDSGRKQRVAVEEMEDTFRLWSIVARPASLQGVENVAMCAWQKNRATFLVGFRLDERGRMVGESWVPKPGLTEDEFTYVMRRVAMECDSFEFQLTGMDRE